MPKQSFNNHIKRYLHSVIMSVTYGKRSPRYETPGIQAIFDTEAEYNQLAEPGATPPLDFFPFLKYIPEWTGLAGWKKRVRDCRQHQRDLYFGLLDETMGKMERGEETGCHMEEILSQQKELGLNREMMGYVVGTERPKPSSLLNRFSRSRYLGGTILVGGADTSAGFLLSAILLMTVFPEIQKKAQMELDKVVGSDRLPMLEDLKELPYVRAIIQEVCRRLALVRLYGLWIV